VLGQLISKATEKKAENLTAAEREQRTQLIVDLVAGISSALDGRNAPTAITAARTELENNSMVMPPLQSGMAGGALGAVGTGSNKRVLNNQERQMEMLGQGMAGQETSTSSISWGLEGVYEWLFGTPAEPLPPEGPLVNPATKDADMGTPGRPAQVLEPMSLPGQANEGPREGLITTQPLQENARANLILQDNNETRDKVQEVTPGNFFDGTRYSPKVRDQATWGDHHGFPEAADGFSGEGTVTTLVGGDGIVRWKLTIPGSYNGKEGVFEYIREPDRTINHRLFIPNR
jgi:hypothetical protein